MLPNVSVESTERFMKSGCVSKETTKPRSIPLPVLEDSPVPKSGPGSYGPCPRSGVFVRQERHGRHRIGAVAILTTSLENGCNIFRERHFIGSCCGRLGGWADGRSDKRGQRQAEKPKNSWQTVSRHCDLLRCCGFSTPSAGHVKTVAPIPGRRNGIVKLTRTEPVHGELLNS